MTSSERFNDDEMKAFFDAELHDQAETMRTEHEQTIVRSRLWDAAERLGMDLAVGRDPAGHENDFTALIKVITEILSVLPLDKDPSYSREEHVHATASREWDTQMSMIGHIKTALDAQMYGSLPTSEKALIKKHIMARIIVIGEGSEQWLALADAALEGDALDSNNPEDFTFIAEALEITANLDNSPEMKLYDNVLTLLGVPPLSEDIPEDYDMEQLELLTYAARDIVEATFTTAGQSQQPDRHSMIHEVAQSYCLVDDVDLTALIKLTDSYAELKSSQK